MKKANATRIAVDSIDDKNGTSEQQERSLFQPRPISSCHGMPPIETSGELPDILGLFKSKKVNKQQPGKQETSDNLSEIKTNETTADLSKPKIENANLDGASTLGFKVPQKRTIYSHMSRVKTPEARGDKDRRFTECPFSEFGCTMSGEALQVRRHIRDESAFHLAQMCETILQLSNQTRDALTETANFHTESEVAAQRVCQLGSLYSSQFIWRISDYAESFANARRGRPAIIYSPPFFTHRQGYKLAAAIGLYGDGDAIGEFTSVFITILRGEHDSILPWPFRCPVTFTLVNLKGGADIQATLTPRINENNMPFLGKPRSDRNPAFGIKTFTDLRLMDDHSNFVADDCCFIKVDVDLESIHNHIG